MQCEGGSMSVMERGAFDSVVILSPFHWNFGDDLVQTTDHLAREFSRICPTVMVEPPLQWNPRNQHFRVRRTLRGVFGPRTWSPYVNLTVFRRRSFPLGRIGRLRDFDLRRNAEDLCQFLRRQGFRRTLLWHCFPYWSEPFLNALSPRLMVYHCLDHTKQDEESRIVHRADVVFCVSDQLVEKYRGANPNTHLMSNGVNLQLFSEDNPTINERPKDLPSGPPLIGYAGGMNSHLDYELLVKVAESFPNANVILIGYVSRGAAGPQGTQRKALEQLRSLENVRMLGFKNVKELPAYYAAFDVCLIPLRQDEFNKECDPGKFYQYVALGKPVVTTSTSVTRRHRDLCYVADQHGQFIDCVSEAFKEPAVGEIRERRIRMATHYSWSAIVSRSVEQLVKSVNAASDHMNPELNAI